MKKLCLLCNQLDESGSNTCLHCGEATWSKLEEPLQPMQFSASLGGVVVPVEEHAAEMERRVETWLPSSVPTAPKKRGKK
jgi:hypothetical protein